MRTRGLFKLGAAVSVTVAAFLPARAADARPAYRLTEVTVPGQASVQPQDITNAGTIVGYSGDTPASVSAADDIHGFIIRHGAVTVVDRPGTRWTYLTGMTEGGK